MPADIVSGPVPTLPLPDMLTKFYKSGDGELYIGDKTFLSPKSILSYNEHMRSNGQTRLVAFAFRYKGYGRIELYAYDPVCDAVITLHDGGSSDVERMENSRKRAVLDVSTLPKCSFQQWWN